MPNGHDEVAEFRSALLPRVTVGASLAAGALLCAQAWGWAHGEGSGVVVGCWSAIVGGLMASAAACLLGRITLSVSLFFTTAICALVVGALVETEQRALLVLQLGTALTAISAVALLERRAGWMIVWLVTQYLGLLTIRRIRGDFAETGDYIAVSVGGAIALLVVSEVARRSQGALGTALRRGTTDREALARTNAALREARDQALAASTAKSTFLANMSHELRTPLNAIVGYAELLRDEAPNDQWRRDLRAIRGSGKHLLAIIDKLLDLAKVEAGQLEVQHEQVDVVDVARQVCDQLAPLFAGRPVELVVPTGPGVGTAWLDDTRIRQVLCNLLGNAAKFTEQGQVRVMVGGDDERVWFEVVDTGPGISPTLAAQLFQPFVQGPHQAGGTGLGLAITRQIVTLMGGVVDLGPAPGRGTRASVRLPRDGRVRMQPQGLVTESSDPTLGAAVRA